MAPRSRSLQATIAVLLAVASGCIQKPDPTSGAVFLGTYPDGVNYNPFKGSAASDVAFDATVCYPPTSTYCPDGGSTLRVVVPGPGDPNNAFAGGTIVSGSPRNLSGYDAVTFWARSSRGAPLKVGLGADQSDAPLYLAETTVTLSTEWTQYVLPIPQPSRLTASKGLFYLSAGAIGNPATGYTFWLANIQYVTLGNALGGPAPVVTPACAHRSVGDAPFQAFPAGAGSRIPVVFAAGAGNQAVNAAAAYFDFTSSDPAVASVGVDGMVQVNGPGTAVVTARLNGVEGAGPLTVQVGPASSCPAPAALPRPTVAAPAPTLPAGRVISVYNSSGTYNDLARTDWTFVTAPDTKYGEFTIPGTTSKVKNYFLSTYAVAQFASSVDATRMTHLHLDVWTPNGFAFQVQLNNAVLQPNPPAFVTQSTLQVDPGSAPPLVTGAWVPVEIPLSAFLDYSVTGPSYQPPAPANPWSVPLGNTNQLGQMTFQVPPGLSGMYYLDNIYFHD